jgi:TonB-dependent starch-binding outer membrane protein SusC
MKAIQRLLLLALFFIPAAVFSQSGPAKGIVTDSAGAPIEGVSVTVKGTHNVVITNADGRFTIPAVRPDAILEFSYVGYISKEVPAGDGTALTIALSSKGGQMNDVVVTGYGQASRKNITGSIASISAEDFNVGVISSPAELLQGKIAGINVTKSGDPNEQPVVILRGASTLRGGSAQQPLYVIDGVPAASIDLVAPSDIATMDVLKDASATAIYGARAANGVIMITTRRPKAGQTRVAYNAYVAAEEASKKIDMLSAPALRQFLKSNGVTLEPGHANGDYDDTVNNNWQDQVERTGLSNNHNIYFGGNYNNTVFGASINYLNNEGLIRKSDLVRTTIRANIEHHALNDRLKLAVNVLDASSQSSQPPTDIYGSMLTYMPTIRAIEPGGVYSSELPYGSTLNPIGLLNNNSDLTNIKTFLANAIAEVKILPVLKYTLSVTQQTVDTTINTYENSNSELAIGLNGVAGSSTTESTKQLVESFFNYDRSFGLHTIRLLGGYSWEQDRQGVGFGVTTEDFPNDNLGSNNLAVSSPPSGTVTFVNSNIGTLRLISYYARVNYQYGDKYLFQASIRDDGSSAFGVNNRWGYFPAVSGGWRISKERFLENVNWLDDLKLRVGYGVTGNSLGFDPLIAQAQWGLTGRAYTNGQILDGIGPIQNANPSLKWESTGTTNIGVDFSILKGLLNGALDLYDKITSNLIYDYPVSATQFPVSNLTANVGRISNKGIELQLNATPVKTRNFSWRSSFNIAHNINNVVSISNPVYNTPYINTAFLGGQGQSDNWSQLIEAGHPIGTFDIWHYMGKNANGVSIFRSAQGDTTSSPSTADFRLAGNAQPQLLMGWNNTFKYQRFDLNFFFRAVTGAKILNATLASLNNVLSAKTQNIPTFSLTESFNDINAPYISDRFLENGSYLRLDNATLGYTFKLNTKAISQFRIYGSANNLFVFTGYKGVDPEITIGGLTPGIDNNNFYPKTRSFLFGVNMIF